MRRTGAQSCVFTAKNEFGDDIASRRPMLREVHRSRKFESGFEGGIQGIAYRVVTPVFDGSQYIGAIEFGIDTDYIVDQLREMLGAEAVMLLHEERIGAADSALYQNGIGKYRFVHYDMSKARLLEEFSRNNAQMRSKTVTIGENTFEITPIFLQENDGRQVGAILCIQNITGGYQDVETYLWESVALTVGLITVFLILFEYAFGAMVSKIRFQEEYIRTILNSQKNIIIVSDGSHILFSNQAFLDYFHISALDDFTREHQCICDFFEQSDTEHYIQPTMNGVQWTEYIISNPMQEHKAKITFEGKTSIFDVHAQMMKFKDDVRYVVIFDDITRLNELATLDALTRVPNRFQFNKSFEYSMNLSRRSGRPFSLILFDIDHFKRINDRHGHLMGDEVLKTLADLVRHQIRKSDVLARWGGEEFVILLPETHLEPAFKLAETLRLKIEAHPFDAIGTVTCSMGVVEYDLHETEDGMMYRADQNLYRAKEEGRNRVCISN